MTKSVVLLGNSRFCSVEREKERDTKQVNGESLNNVERLGFWLLLRGLGFLNFVVRSMGEHFAFFLGGVLGWGRRGSCG